MANGKKKFQKKQSLQKQLTTIKRKMFYDTELKYYCKEVEAPSISSTYSTIWNLSDMGTGTSGITRVGDSISPKVLKLRMLFLGLDSSNVIRCVIAQATAESDNIVAADFPHVTSGTGQMQPLGCYATVKNRKYRVLKDFMVFTQGSTAAANYGKLKTITIKNLNKIRYDSGLTTQSRGGLVMWFISDSTAVSHPACYCTSQLSFTDE